MDYIFSLSTYDEVLQIDSAFRTCGAEPISVKLILFFYEYENVCILSCFYASGIPCSFISFSYPEHAMYDIVVYLAYVSFDSCVLNSRQ
jgi:hypothetical protein